MKVIQLYKNEEKLINSAAQNKRDAQHQLFQQHAPKMLSVCRQYISDLQEAEEAMLNGFLKVFANLRTFKFEGSFEGWIRRIMIRESISYLRSKKQLAFSDEEIERYEAPSASSISALEVEEIQALIDQLPEGYRIVFVMYAIEGYKHKEIASLLEISVNTSKTQLFKARKMLQRGIGKLKNASYGTT
ncbi:RNA polymerase sigma factor [Sungkyunkwania multivorans]|uniref:RNA polymerase sigma factor n=1 Tax=Sungkyunkwania multivorans TaxID=1173618 RepID=A0ABW3D4Z8_9FLAO